LLSFRLRPWGGWFRRLVSPVGRRRRAAAPRSLLVRLRHDATAVQLCASLLLAVPEQDRLRTSSRHPPSASMISPRSSRSRAAREHVVDDVLCSVPGARRPTRSRKNSGPSA
jgi:hypothetical protein